MAWSPVFSAFRLPAPLPECRRLPCDENKSGWQPCAWASCRAAGRTRHRSGSDQKGTPPPPPPCIHDTTEPPPPPAPPPPRSPHPPPHPPPPPPPSPPHPHPPPLPANPL